MTRPSVEVETAAGERASVAAAADDGAAVVAADGVAPSVVAGEGEAEAAARDACANCEEPLAGDYCHRCGEKRPGARDLSVRHFVAEAAQELTSVEHSKLFRTVAALLFKPGHLTAEYFAGRRARATSSRSTCASASSR